MMSRASQDFGHRGKKLDSLRILREEKQRAAPDLVRIKIVQNTQKFDDYDCTSLYRSHDELRSEIHRELLEILNNANHKAPLLVDCAPVNSDSSSE